jgi:hypothetical protein
MVVCFLREEIDETGWMVELSIDGDGEGEGEGVEVLFKTTRRSSIVQRVSIRAWKGTRTSPIKTCQ